MPTRTISDLGGNYNAVGAWVEGVAPTSADDVVATPTSGPLVVNVSSACRSMDLTGYANTLTLNAALTIGTTTPGPGDVILRLSSTMTVAGTSAVIVSSTSTNVQTVTSAGKTFNGLTFAGSGSSYLLTDDLRCAGLTLTTGTLNAGGFNVTCNNLVSSNSNVRSLIAGTGLWTLNGTSGNWNFSTATNATISAADATIRFVDTGSGNKTFSGGGATYGTVEIEAGGTGRLAINASNTFGKLTVRGSNPKEVRFEAGSTQTLTGGSDSFFSGSSGNPVTVRSSTEGSTWNLTKTSGSVRSNYLLVQDSTAAGGATFNAVSSVNGERNNGWKFVTQSDGKSF